MTYYCVYCIIHWYDNGNDSKGYRCPTCDEPGFAVGGE